MDKANIAKKLINLRGDMTQKEVAEKIGVAQSTYAMYENTARLPSDEVKVKIADFYGESVQAIFFDDKVTISDF